MIKSIFLSIIYLIVAANLYAQNNSIVWSDERPLTWNDFKKKAPKNHLASAMSDITFMINVEFENNEIFIQIEPSLRPKDSWVKKNNKSDYLLKHEQVHFDIYEVYARKFRSEIKSNHYTSKRVQNEITRLFNKYSKLAVDAQDKYDKETEHSIKREKQQEWNDSVAKELKELEEFSESSFKIPLKH